MSVNLSWAQDHKGCAHDHHHEGEHTHFANEYLEWWAASRKQVRSAYCSQPGNLPLSSMEQYLSRNKPKNSISTTVYGMRFKDEDPHLIELMRKLTRFDPFLSIDKDPSKQQQFSLPDGCNRVLCAVKNLFGETAGVKILYALDKYELNMSHLTDDNLAAWKTEEIDILLEAIDDLPPHLVPFKTNKRLKHYKRGYGPSSSTVANAVITVFSVWDDLDHDEQRRSTIIHEIGHNIGNRLKQDESQPWLDLSGWEERENKWTAIKEDAMISKYGATNPAEDFAETFVAYRYNPQELQRVSPQKYAYMKKNVFLGLEYTSEEACAPENSRYAKIIKKAHNNLSDQNIPERKYSLCKKEISQLIQKKKKIDLRDCITGSERQLELKRLTKDLPAQERDLILNRAQFESLPKERLLKVTMAEQTQTKLNILNDYYGAIANNFFNVNGSECTSKPKFGKYDLTDFNEYHFSKKFEFPMDPQKISDRIFELCKKMGGPRKISCRDLKKEMQEHFSADQQIVLPKSNISTWNGMVNLISGYLPGESMPDKKDIEAPKAGRPSFSCEFFINENN